MVPWRLRAFTTAACIFLYCSRSLAAGPELSASLHALYGQHVGDVDAFETYDPYHFGFGARLGVSLDTLYLGAYYHHFFGTAHGSPNHVKDDMIVFNEGVSTRHVGAELGVDFKLGPLSTLRPSIGIGANTSGKVCFANVYNNNLGNIGSVNCPYSGGTDIALAPGIQVLVLPGSFKISGELRYNKVFAPGDDPDGLFLGVGIGLVL